jgi:hypothetical protein
MADMSNFDPASLGLSPTPAPSPEQDPAALGLSPEPADDSSSTSLGLSPFSANTTNLDEIKANQAQDPYSLSDAQWQIRRKADENAGPLEKAQAMAEGGWGALKHLAGLPFRAADEENAARAQALKTISDNPSLSGLGEAAAQYLGTQAATSLDAAGQVGSLIPQVGQRALDYLKQAAVNPTRFALRTAPFGTGGQLAEAISPETPDQAEALTQQYKANALRDYEKAKISTAAPSELLQGFQPMPATAEGLAFAETLPAWEAGAEALGLRNVATAGGSLTDEALSNLPKAAEGAVPPVISTVPPVIPGMAENAAQAAVNPGADRALQIAGDVAEAVGGKVEQVGGAPRRGLEYVSELLTGSKGAAKVVEAGALFHFPFIKAIAGLEGAGVTISKLGQVFQQLGQSDSLYGRLWGITQKTTSPLWMKRLAGMPLTRAVGTAGDFASFLAKGVGEGAVAGATFSAATGASPEETGANIATMGMFGLGGRALSLPYVRQMKLVEPTRAGALNIMERNLRGGATPDTLAKVGDWPFVNALALETLQPGWKVQFLDEPAYNGRLKPGEGQGTPGVTDWDAGSGTVFVNADEISRGPATTVYHEIFHPLFMAESVNRPGVRSAMDDLMLQHGLSVEQAAPGYADRLIGDNFPRTVQEQLAHDGLTRGGTAYRKATQALNADGLTPEQVEQQYQTRRQQAVSDWVEKKNTTPGLGESQPGDWIYSELLAEAGVRQLWGKNVVEVAAGLKGGRDVPVEYRPATVFGEKFESLLDDPAMGKLVRDVLTGEKNFRPGIDTPANQEAPLRPEEIGGKKVPETGQTFQDYFQKMKSGRNELKSAKEQRKGIRIRQQVMEQTFPTSVTPLPLNDTSDQMTLRQRSIGGVERRGRKLGDAFYQNPDISDSMKTTAAALEHGMGSDERFKAWYNETHKNGISSTEDLTAKVIHDFQPDEFFVDKHGHLLARGKDFGTLEDTLLPKLAERHGEYSLDPWGGNIQSALADAKTYSRNLAAGRPGDTGIGARKRDILNLAMFGNNAGNQGPNPLRAGLHERDSAGIIRSLRIDRLETLERSQAQYGQIPHTSGAQNLSPQLNTLKQFSPSIDPRGIKSAAVQHPDGRVWEDSMHFLANRKALQAGVKPLDLMNLKQGFTTNTPGEFLSREEAFKRADELGQLEPESPILGDHKKPLLASEALQPNQYSPKAVDLDHMRRLQYASDLNRKEKAELADFQAKLPPITPSVTPSPAEFLGFQSGDKRSVGYPLLRLPGEKFFLEPGDEYARGRPLSREALEAFKQSLTKEPPHLAALAIDHFLSDITWTGRDDATIMANPEDAFAALDNLIRISPAASEAPLRQYLATSGQRIQKTGTPWVEENLSPAELAARTQEKFYNPNTERLASLPLSSGIAEKTSQPTAPRAGFNADVAAERALKAKASLQQFSPSAAKPEIAQLGTSEDKNNFGDPLGTQYHATPEDWAKWQDVQGRLKQLVASGNFDAYPPLGKENEAIKNRYGGNPPAAPLASPGQFSPSGKRQDYLGLVDDRAGVTGMWTPDAYKVDHSDLPGRGERWRYINSTKSVEWNEEPNRENLQRVEDWLERRDSPVAKHSVWTDWSDGKAHLETLEPHPPQFSAKAEDRPEISEHPFYSQLEKTVEDKFSGSQMPAAQLAAILRNPQNSVKADEMKWTGLDDFLKGKSKVTKSEVQDFLKANAVQIKEVAKTSGEWNQEIEADTGKTPTKFEHYQLPGGSNYQELLFQLPPKHDAGNVIPYEKWLTEQPWYEFWSQGVDADSVTKAERLYSEWVAREREGRNTQNFPSGHWDEPNVVAHSRVNEREDTAGKPGLFIEEIQSDWHQKGRRAGYLAPGELEELNQRNRQLPLATMGAAPDKVPDAPFKTTWHEMVFRRMVRMAAEKGKDWLGWTTGEQQAERYDLSKHVDSISWVRESGELRAFKGDNEVLHQNGVEDSDMLADYIGKEAAAKLATQPAQSNPIGKPVRWLEGEDLKIGGAGMKGFYDKILVDYANKFGKKFGTKVEDRSIPISENEDKNLGLEYYAATNTYDVIDKESGAAVKTNLTEAEARKYLRIGGAREKVHSLPVTPEMKKSVLEQGVALFSPKADEAAARAVDDVVDAAAKERAAMPVVQFSPADKRKKLGNAVGPEEIHLVHLSSNPDLREVSPKFFGKGRANVNDTRGGNKSYWFEAGSPLGGDAPIFGQGGYHAYAATILGDKIYDLRAGKPDVLNYFGQPNREKADDIVRRAGYDGILIHTDAEEDGRKVAYTFKKVPVTAAGEFKGDVAPRQKNLVDKTAEPAETADVNKVANTEKLGGLTSIPMVNPPPWEPATPEGRALKAAGLSVIRRGEPGSWSFYAFKPGEIKDLGRVFTKDNHIVDATAGSKKVLDALKAETTTQLSSDAKQRSANFSLKTDEPESVGRAAIRVGDKVFYGKDHNAAKVEAVRGGKGIPEIEEDGEYGFQTNQRPFVSREAGRRVAEAAGQTFKSQQTKPAPLTAEQIQAPGSVHYSPGVEVKEPKEPGRNAEDAGFGNYWVSPSGKFYPAGDHPEWASRIVSMPPEEAKERAELLFGKGRGPMTASRLARVAEDVLKERGWLRVSREREGRGQTAFLNGRPLSEKQKSAVELWKSANPNIEIVDVDSLLFRNQGSASFSPKAEAKPGILGTTDKDDNYRTWGAKVSNLAAEENNHPEKTGTVEDGTTFNWRYRPDTKTVYWWSRPSAELKEAAEAWLNKTGKNPVDHHVVIGGGGATGAYHTEAHGKGVPGQQFSPSEEPDAVWKPAGKDEKTGRIYTGWVHGDVLANAKKDGKKLPLSALGFVTRSGKFLDRQAAFRRAVEMGQIDSETWEGRPGRLDTVNFLDAQQFSPKLLKKLIDDNERAFSRSRSNSHGWWISPRGSLVPLTTGEHPTEAIKLLGLKPEKDIKLLNHVSDRSSAVSQNALEAYAELVRKGWRAVVPQRDFKGPVLYVRGGEVDRKAATSLTPDQRAALTSLAIAHEYGLKDDSGNDLYRPPPPPNAPESAEPGVPWWQRDKQFSPQAPTKQDYRYAKRIVAITEWRKGCTFNVATGKAAQAGKDPLYNVSIYPDPDRAVILPAGQKLAHERVAQFIADNRDLLKDPDNSVGTWINDEDGKTYLDISISTPDIKFAKFAGEKYNQKAIWDLKAMENIPTGGTGEAVKGLLPAQERLAKLREEWAQEHGPVADENFKKPEEDETQGELAGATTPGFARTQDMTLPQIAEYFPESVEPETRGQQISYDILNAPLVRGMTRPQAVSAFADKAVEEMKKWQDHPLFQSGLRWYSEFVPMLKKVYGKDAGLMAQLLAATSPRSDPGVNWGFAEEALDLFKRGHFDKQLAKYEQGLKMGENGTLEKWYNARVKKGLVKNAPKTASSGTWLGEWVHANNLKPHQANGQLFGMRSGAVLEVLSGHWLQTNKGLKVNQFLKNLMGTDHGATVDVWAARLMRRLGYEGLQERHRILPMNETAVSDADFKFSQEVFAEAAKRMGITPDALQGGMWFAEKSLWNDKGWSPLDLGDYRKEIKKGAMIRQRVGLRLEEQKDKGKEGPPPEQKSLL